MQRGSPEFLQEASASDGLWILAPLLHWLLLCTGLSLGSVSWKAQVSVSGPVASRPGPRAVFARQLTPPPGCSPGSREDKDASLSSLLIPSGSQPSPLATAPSFILSSPLSTMERAVPPSETKKVLFPDQRQIFFLDHICPYSWLLLREAEAAP